MYDIEEEQISDETKINGVEWNILKERFWSDPYFDRKAFAVSLADSERVTLTRLCEAQEEIGWTNDLVDT